MNQIENRFDVAIVGGSIAGCASAILFAKMGYSVVILEQKSVKQQQPSYYKQLCTHFIQPSAVHVLDELDLAYLRDSGSSTQTQAKFIVDDSVIDHPHAYGTDRKYALNLERRVLDPALRDATLRHGVTIMDAAQVENAQRQEGVWKLSLQDDPATVSARMLIAADGRQSRLAKRVENPTELKPNDRAAVFAYFSGIDRPALDRSLFFLRDDEMGFLYPLIEQRTLLSVYITKERAKAWRNSEDIGAELLDYFSAFPGVPDLGGAKLESQVLGYLDYPNQVRQPAHRSIAFVGDAAMSLDPMSGVGCGFALLSASLLAKAFSRRDLSEQQIEEGLVQYASDYRQLILPHMTGICADSLIGKDRGARARAYRSISGNEVLSRAYLSLTGRLISPSEFQRAFLRASLTHKFEPT